MGIDKANIKGATAGDASIAKPIATNIFSFFSPQKGDENKEAITDQKKVKVDTKVTSTQELLESSGTADPASKQQDSFPVENNDSKLKLAAGEAPSPSDSVLEKEDVSTGEKFLGSVKSLGEFFANPYT